MDKYKHLFKSYNEELKKEKENIEKICCDNQELLIKDYCEVCINCGLINNNIIENHIDNYSYQNVNHLCPNVSLKTYTNGNFNRNIMNWHYYDKDNNSYYFEKQLITKIKEEILNLKLENIDLYYHNNLNRILSLYKTFYIDNKINSRGNIKKSLLIYCILKIFKDKELSLIKLLTDNNLTKKNYEYMLNKIKDLVEEEDLIIN